MAVLLIGLLVLSPVRLRKIVGLVAAALMMLFNWLSLWFVAQSYYGSLFSFQAFFLRASQYKPWFFKTLLLEVWLGLGIITSVWFLVSLMRYTRHKNIKTREHMLNEIGLMRLIRYFIFGLWDLIFGLLPWSP